MWYAKLQYAFLVIIIILIAVVRRNEYFAADGSFRTAYVVFLFSVFSILLVYGYWIVVLKVKRYLDILENGNKATAKILNKQLRVYKSFRPIVRFQLEIAPEGESSYIVKTKAAISKIDLHRFEIGQIVKIRISTLDKNKVVIDSAYAFVPRNILF
jgi:hypothetical protein